MIKETKIVTRLHLKTKRNYIQRMYNDKVTCMKVASKYSYDYWDGKRKFGYGGYKYIPSRWKGVAKQLIKKFRLSNHSKLLDIGCGKAFLLLEIKKILPEIKLYGLDISSYALKCAPKCISKNLILHNASSKFPYKKKEFDLSISINTLHNLKLNDLLKSLKEIKRVSKKTYICVESYRNQQELFNLQCWALTCQSFFSKDEWTWIYKKNNLKGLYEFIYFQ